MSERGKAAGLVQGGEGRGAPVWRLACLLWCRSLFQIQLHLGAQVTNLLRPQGSEIPLRNQFPSPPAKKNDFHLLLCRQGACVCSCTFTWACKKEAPFGNFVCEVLDGVMPEDFRTGPLTWRLLVTEAVIENLWWPRDWPKFLVG